MSKEYKKFYYIRGNIFENSGSRMNGKGKALRYCKDNGIDESEIYELSNQSEYEFFKTLLEKEQRNEIHSLKSHEKVALIGFFTNDNGEQYAPYEFETSFIYRDSGTNQVNVIYVAENVYDLTRELILCKTLYDYTRKGSGLYLKVYYQDKDNEFKEWHIGDKETFIQEAKERHKKMLVQKRAIRDRQKFDRLLRLRDEGKITDTQRQELYRLEKVFGGKDEV